MCLYPKLRMASKFHLRIFYALQLVPVRPTAGGSSDGKPSAGQKPGSDEGPILLPKILSFSKVNRQLLSPFSRLSEDTV